MVYPVCCLLSGCHTCQEDTCLHNCLVVTPCLLSVAPIYLSLCLICWVAVVKRSHSWHADRTHSSPSRTTCQPEHTARTQVQGPNLRWCKCSDVNQHSHSELSCRPTPKSKNNKKVSVLNHQTVSHQVLPDMRTLVTSSCQAVGGATTEDRHC